MKISVFVGVSLDGFIARGNGSLDFLHGSGGDESHGYEEFFSTVDALLMGRNTYETVREFNSWPYGKKPVFVLSSRPLQPAPANAVIEHAKGNPTEIIAMLAAREFKHVYVDGGRTIQSFLAAGCISRLIIARVPVLIGAGIPLFGALPHDIALKHVATRVYASGLVQSEYAIPR